MASFLLPKLPETGDKFGPPNEDAFSAVPDEFKGIPFAPFAKSDKIGRIADWNSPSGSGYGDDRNRRGQLGRGTTAFGSSMAGNAFAYQHGEDEATFSLVDNARASGPGGFGGRGGFGAGGRGGRGGARGGPGGRGGRGSAKLGGAAPVFSPFVGRGGFGARGRGGFRGGRGGGRFRDWDRPQRTREASVAVGPEWEQLEEIDFTRLGKLHLGVEEASTISEHGTLYGYDRTFDRINSVRLEKPLQPLDRIRYNITTSDDPIIQRIASEPAQASEDGVKPTRIYITDSILALLMCLPRAVYPWDITITSQDGTVFFDKRDGGAFDFVTVNENAADPPLEPTELKDDKDTHPANRDAAAAAAAKADPINTPSSLSLEATYILQNFSFLVVKEEQKHTLVDGENPFYSPEETDPLASCGYRYRRFNISSAENDPIELVVRTEVDAFLPGATASAPQQLVTIKTLNEFDSKSQGAGGAPDWRSKLDSQRGAVVATEMKNNSFKLARFAVQAILAGADTMKLGYISRASPKDASRHVILATQSVKPREFAAQMNLNLKNGWGIVRTIVDLVRKKDGKFVLLKDPNKSVIRLYSVPLDYPNQEDEIEEEEKDAPEYDEDDM
ncbi:translation initiation factor eIF-3, subunit D [Tilletiaria anomala UBC 951]|uniref:Eukaryotic translation initiation factor 3 subunit D n=1 Tax=Tilletiaria anomala (strain ATCC 24038 / CBS 436.72 / UBC 951) TaxID=1037660 RepID=A0A066WMW3_TILAU|nr:translation initiation factor eIF-3, subunit D [Tilletiaria anomala UBC 951]KDN51970.1 translation initiation factor eIF-3, subunit D [Tilletiaria anomala UBC 951]